MVIGFVKKFALAVSLLAASASMAGATAWDDYKAKYLAQDGAIIDTGNGNMSHTEGQSYGLTFALAYNDKEAFARILKWTDDNLADPVSGLYCWAYRRDGGDPVADKNNATDGDLMIAWALLKAGQKWHVKEYTKKAEKLANAISALTVTKFGGYNVILPGANAFFYNSYIIVNPSYYIYPALTALAKQTYQKLWKDVNADGKKLLSNLQGQTLMVSPDWVKLLISGENMPAEQWPPRFSYDAIRVPLYLYWDDPNCKELIPYRKLWSGYSEFQTPAWFSVVGSQKADYMMSSGLKAVRDLVMGKPLGEPDIKKSEDYYNASLHMLAYMAYRDHH